MIPVFVPCTKLTEVKLPELVGENRTIDKSTTTGMFLLNLLTRNHVRHMMRYRDEYPCLLKLFLSRDYKEREGLYLNASQVYRLNKFIQGIYKQRFMDHITTYMHFDSSLSRAIAYARELLDIDKNMMSDELLVKEFQRFRAKPENKSLDWLYVYKK